MRKLKYEIIANDCIVAYAENLHLAKVILSAIFDNYDGTVDRVCINKVKGAEDE